ncbi:MAG: phosphotransferase family protein, partial [Acidimicrobiales bacterium]
MSAVANSPRAGGDDAQEAVGIDPPGVTAWFADHVPGTAPPLSFRLVAGGRSNLTYRVEDAAGHAWALRRPPVSHVLPTAHDMAREHRIISALGPTPVPVPRTYGLCRDESVTGGAFYVMEFVDGLVLRSAAVAEGAMGAGARRAAGDSLADTLAALHDVDPDATGLGDLGRRGGYVERQVRRWTEQFRQSAGDVARSGGTALVEQVGAELAARVPPQRATTIVHGDYRLDNTVMRPDGTVAAVLDWELCTLGDPMADVGLLADYWAAPTDGGGPLLGPHSASTLPGFCTREELLARYARTSGRDVSGVGYFAAFGY